MTSLEAESVFVTDFRGTWRNIRRKRRNNREPNDRRFGFALGPNAVYVVCHNGSNVAVIVVEELKVIARKFQPN